MGQDDRHDEVSESTRRAEAKEAHHAHEADRPATSDEEQMLDEDSVDDGVREHYQEMAERGVEAKGEGRIP